MAVDLFVMDVVRHAGELQEWWCGGCGNFVHAGSEWLVFIRNPVENGQPMAIPVLVHADCGQGLAHAWTWEEWRLRNVKRDPDAQLGRAREAIQKALKGWAGLDMDELNKRTKA